MAKTRTPEPDWQEAFLAHLRDTGNVRRSCEAAGVARSWVYERRDADPALAAEWKAAALDAADLIEETLLDRGLNGWDEPVFQGGQKVGEVRRYAHNVAMVILKASNPEKYGDRTELRHSGPNGGPIQFQSQAAGLSALTDEQLDQLAAIHAALEGSGGEGEGAPEVRP